MAKAGSSKAAPTAKSPGGVAAGKVGLNNQTASASVPVSLKHDYTSAPDDALVKWSQGGDTEAFEQLVYRHRDKIYARALLMMRNEEEALDLSQ